MFFERPVGDERRGETLRNRVARLRAASVCVGVLVLAREATGADESLTCRAWAMAVAISS